MAADALSLGTRIKRARERMRLTQEELGRRVGKSVRTVNDWENDRTYPKNSIGALEELFGHSLEGPEDLPPIVARNTDDPRVMALWNIKIIPPRSREGMIAYLLERDGPMPSSNGASRSHASS